MSQVLKYENYMQYTLRTGEYRYSALARIQCHQEQENGSLTVTLNWDVPQLGLSTELYDLKTDPDERFNKAEDPEYASVKDSLTMELHKRAKTIHNVLA
jgi:hypothetical protein